jgi:creatinine amidohydrolase/Fe(II)-dependent formamide hydrolase-like protein
VIGDEHDTTVRTSHAGIPHYDGLYDQSRYFDQALSRFYAAKGWALSQFSLLRPLSELLIERLLAQRYPDLQRLQVSCHAAHEESGLIRPCGRCEKCRRIVAMLLAADADPSLCGYTEPQIESVRSTLVEKEVHQEKSAAQHLAAVLFEKGLIREPRIGSVRARKRPEVVKLRFHPERSPVETVPLAIRRSLYEIFLSEAEGSVRRLGHQWVDFDLLSDPALAAPYPFERPRTVSSPSRSPGAVRAQDSRSVLWSELTWPEAGRYLKQVDIALLPVGSIEQHGPHLPLDVDAFDAEYLARRVAEACSVPRPLVLPLVPYGVSYHHQDFPGTLSVSNQALAQFVYEIGLSAARNGINKLVIINGHGGNAATLNFAAQMINRDTRIFTCVDSGETSDPDILALAETRNDVHAGEIETSTTLAVRPGLVQMRKAKPFVPKFSTHYLDFTSSHSIDWYARTAGISKSGVFGDPTKATAEKGEAIWKLYIDHLVALVEHLKDLTLDEIHEQRV